MVDDSVAAGVVDATKLPQPLVALFERLAVLYGQPTASTIARTMAAPKRSGFFVNPLKGAAPGRALPADAVPIPGIEGCYSVPASERQALLASDAVERGQIYPMNPASAAAARVLGVQPEQEVLDLAAAPGGKTLLLAAAMANSGRIAAVEPIRGRFHRMRANLARCGVSNVQFYQADGRSIGRKVPGRFDAVLLDAPCSSEARIRFSEPASYQHWKPRKVREAARKQKGLLRSAFLALKPGGRLLYCTCSFAPEENELVVDHLLAAEPAAEVLELPRIQCSATTGISRWRGKDLDERLNRSLRMLPDELWDGFFLCLLVKR